MKKESLKQQAYNIIKNKIITCKYPPNFLLNEEKLKEEIGASRTPIRDALSRLEQEDLVRILPKKGIMVSSLSIREINSLYEARMLIEPYAIAHYAIDIAKERFQYYEKRIREMGKKTRQGEEVQDDIYDLDDQMHLEMINATENEYFKALYERISYQNQRLRILSGVKSKERLEETQREHIKIIEACLEERWTDAADAMREHLVCSKRASFATMIESGDMLL
ncbi:GntR family transcriptional regulator [Faecalicatena acetigenes]|uniref:GntR family transcriptional regulator n=1 Tax=Faecalicatena acetigenes TaxID=2981790 RepID=A0ABT2TED1_9FIRM|nr:MULTISPECIES: GntR family transcriptional regulator [Lachnospiraceae]MCU6748654.1 GntR family transcriptional regulator [Faecalicatena acetigenes]SCI56685.1 Uncharacterized HTH-type transcriptional regulator ydfH [uncultured Clostridium sp.]